MKRSTITIRRSALVALAAAILVPAANASVRPDDRAGVRSVDGIVLGDVDGNVWGIGPFELLANEPGVGATDNGVPASRIGVGQMSDAYTKSHLSELRNPVFSTPVDEAYVRALNVRGEALNEQNRIGSYFTALDAQSRALNETYGLGSIRPDDRAGVRSVDTEPVVVPTGGGFNWGDAGIGALGAFGGSLLLAGSMLLVLHASHRRREGKVAVL